MQSVNNLNKGDIKPKVVKETILNQRIKLLRDLMEIIPLFNSHLFNIRTLSMMIPEKLPKKYKKHFEDEFLQRDKLLKLITESYRATKSKLGCISD